MAAKDRTRRGEATATDRRRTRAVIAILHLPVSAGKVAGGRSGPV
jgi:hypothetical protein